MVRAVAARPRRLTPASSAVPDSASPRPPAPLPTPVDGVLFQALEDGAVLFSATSELYFGLNHVGARIWELLPPATSTLDELCARLQQRYQEARPTVLRRDVLELLERLRAEGLVKDGQVSAG